MASYFSGLVSFEQKLEEVLAKGAQSLQACCLEPGFKYLLAFNLTSSPLIWKRSKKLVIVLPFEKQIAEWAQYFTHYQELWREKTFCIWPTHLFWGQDGYLNEETRKKARIKELSHICNKEANKVIFTSLEGLSQYTTFSLMQEKITIFVGQELDFEVLVQSLIKLGYQGRSRVDEPGSYALKGAILDLFPSDSKDPVRIEFFDNIVERIRFFDQESQKTSASIDKYFVLQAQEFLIDANDSFVRQSLYEELLRQNLDPRDVSGIMQTFASTGNFAGLDFYRPFLSKSKKSLLDHLLDDAFFYFPLSMASAFEHYLHLEKQREIVEEKLSGSIFPRLSWHHLNLAGLEKRLKKAAFVLDLSSSQSNSEVFCYQKPAKSPIFGEIKNAVNDLIATGSRFIIFVPKDFDFLDALIKLEELDFHCQEKNAEDLFSTRVLVNATDAAIGVVRAELAGDFWDADLDLYFISYTSFFPQVKKVKNVAKKVAKAFFKELAPLKRGDFLVHDRHGIGLCQGICTLLVNKIMCDFVQLEYQGGDKIYVPVDKIKELKIYAGSELSQTKLDKLGSNSFTQRKAKAKAKAIDIAKELLATHAKRKMVKARVLGQAPAIYHDFVDDFPFAETDDQLSAIADIEADLQTNAVMDRMIVGDVGFGKTEVAIRAAMRVILDGCQVLVLAPTTILADQHYDNFYRRLSPYGVNLGLLNRFVKKNAQKETIFGLANGFIDIAIGTHRLLSKDIKTKNLGLVVIDEEQKFGVVHKEKIKALRLDASILTLTATPIPRTLHMATIGLKDVSIIATPPKNRLAIKTRVSTHSDKLLQEVIFYELKRGGQVFFVHNKIEDLERWANKILDLVPSSKVAIAHGQLPERSLEKIMSDFSKQRFSVLICTTIVESGLDLPNANTLVVSRAENYGLASLHQLRGRVGRSSVQAYAYFFCSPNINEDAQKRLDALVTYQDLGAGFHIANQDLDIRGVGNILGSDQAGHVEAIGLELYSDYLEETIRQLKGQELEVVSPCEIKINAQAMIPAKYVPDETERLKLYRDLFGLSKEAISDFSLKLQDCYGAIPESTNVLLSVAKLKLTLEAIKASRIIERLPGKYEISFNTLTVKEIERLQGFSVKAKQVKLTSEFKLQVDLSTLSLATNAKIDKLDLILSNIALK